MGRSSTVKPVKKAGKAKAKAKAAVKSSGASRSNGVTVVQKSMAAAASGASVMKRPSGHAVDRSLAGQLEQAAYHGGGMIEMNKVWELSEKVKASGAVFAISNDVIFLVKPMSCTALETQVFKQLPQPCGIRTLRFHPFQEGTFDLRGFSKLVTQYIPNVQTISAWSLVAKNFELIDLDSVQRLTFMSCEFRDPVFDLHLPNLKELVFQCTVPYPKALSKSLLACPRIEVFSAHKIWCEDIPSLYLPSCKQFTFRRGDCVSKLHLYLPRAEHVNLDANYDLSDLKFLTQGRREIKAFCPKPGEPQSQFTVSVVNAFCGLKKGPQYLLSHPRVTEVVGLQDSDDDGFF